MTSSSFRDAMLPLKDGLSGARRALGQAWRAHRAPRFPTPDVRTVLTALEAVGLPDSPSDHDSERPVFLLSTGWRTGSTLLQRILVTDSRLLLWGEPLGRLALVPRLTESLCAISADWPPSDYWIGERPEEMTSSWIANLYPTVGDMRAALQDWMVRWLAVPARARGRRRWGLKEVRFSAAEACVLRWLFPGAVFLVLVRHPLDAYRSAMHSKLWYRWPDWPIDCAAAFARHWNRLALSWLQVPEDFGQLTIKYEDLAFGRVDFESLEKAMGLKLDAEQALSAQVGGSMNLKDFSWYERLAILKETRGAMQVYGYSDQPETGSG